MTHYLIKDTAVIARIYFWFYHFIDFAKGMSTFFQYGPMLTFGQQCQPYWYIFFVYSFEIKHQRFKRPSKDQKIQLGFISATSIREDICNTITQGLMLIHIQQGIYLGFTVAIFPF